VQPVKGETNQVEELPVDLSGRTRVRPIFLFPPSTGSLASRQWTNSSRATLTVMPTRTARKPTISLATSGIKAHRKTQELLELILKELAPL